LLHLDTPLAIFQGNATDAATRSAFNTYTNGGYYRDNFIESFVQYGKTVMTHFADRVPVWVTFNEPWYATTNSQAVYNVIRAHAEIYHYYHDVLNGTGSVTYKSGGPIGIPLDPTNETHVAASCRYNDFYTGVYANPIYLGQDYPETYKETVKDFVPLNQSDLDYFKGTAGKFTSTQRITDFRSPH
jgi:beta-glucosidase/6-phospho-beta-glucosidase/beta-galactosidase